MKKRAKPTQLPEGHLQRYDWSKATRGRLAARAAKASALLRLLDPELAVNFPDSRSVNEALRALLALDEALPRRRPGRSRRLDRGIRHLGGSRRRSIGGRRQLIVAGTRPR